MLANAVAKGVLYRKTAGKKTRGGNSDTMDQQEDMETTDFGNGIHQEHTESIITESKPNTKGKKSCREINSCSTFKLSKQKWIQSMQQCKFLWCDYFLVKKKNPCIYYRLPMMLREGNVISHVCLSVHRGSHVTNYPWCFGSHCTVPPGHGPHCTGTPPSLLVTSGGHQWRPVQTC